MSKVAVLYQSRSEQERQVTEFEREYTKRTGLRLSLYDLNTPSGANLAELYGITQYPAVLATADDGSLLQLWQGEVLPLINEVAYYQSQ
jgi:hypothetical protein